jgi:DNA-binding Lrp family transcriptional regulator
VQFSNRAWEEIDVNEKKLGNRAARQKLRKWQAFRLRVRIVAACHLRKVTVEEIAEREGISLSAVRYQFDRLVKEDWIRICGTVTRRAVVQNHYCATRLKLITDSEFEKMAEEERHETDEGVLLDLLENCAAAFRNGKLAARQKIHLSRDRLWLDRRTWGELQSDMDRLLEVVLECKVESEMRFRQGGEKSLPTLAALAAFRTPASVIDTDPHPRTRPLALLDFLRVCEAAHEGATLMADPDSHLTQTPMVLDLRARRRLQDEMERMRERILGYRNQAERRLRKGGEKAIPTFAFLGAFGLPATVMDLQKV